MRWRGQRESDNVEDRRGLSVSGRGIALSGTGIVLLLALALVTGQDPIALLETVGGPAVSVEPGQGGRVGAPTDESGQFTSVVLASTEDVWGRQFDASGRRYEEPTLVLFSEAVDSACGFTSAAVGPFYCPVDRKVYLDVAFFDELGRRFGAPGDFAHAYVIAHEVGHHVQNLLGVADRVRGLQQRASREDANALSVRMELQADCLAGVWAHDANRQADLLDPGDVEEGLRAAAAIGDDQLQKQAQGYTVPESWTHGSSAMRAKWLRRGLERGSVDACDTFAARDL